MKDDLRYKYKIKRKYFQNSRREVADGVIKDALIAAYGSFNSFFVYNSFGSEADTKGIIQALLNDGKEVYLPRVEGNEMVAVPYKNGDELKLSRYNIYEPQGKSVNCSFDVAIIPLLAVNSRGYRLGYGGGYYDKFLKQRSCLKVGIGYFLQMTDEFEEDTWDVQLDSYICEKGIYTFEKH
jgi:5-formyltetrahydrofolate cyclo-ligase